MSNNLSTPGNSPHEKLARFMVVLCLLMVPFVLFVDRPSPSLHSMIKANDPDLVFISEVPAGQPTSIDGKRIIFSDYDVYVLTKHEIKTSDDLVIKQLDPESPIVSESSFDYVLCGDDYCEAIVRMSPYYERKLSDLETNRSVSSES